MSRYPDFEKFVEPLEDIMSHIQTIDELADLIIKHALNANPRNPTTSLDQIFKAAKQIKNEEIAHLKKQLRTAWELRIEAVRDEDIDTSEWVFVEQDAEND